MFSSIGWGEIAVLMVAGLVILGPERLPGAIKWTFGALRQAREYATGARESLKDEFGTDLDDFRQPLSELNQLRGMTPRSMITKHLLDGDDSFLTGKFDSSPNRDARADAGADRSADATDIPIKPVSATPRERTRRTPSIDDWDAT